jgi:hypothetical protein
VDVALDAVVIDPPVPLTMLQAPVPTVGVLPARVTDVKPQVAEPVWSVPALEAVGVALRVVAVDDLADAAVQLFELV